MVWPRGCVRRDELLAKHTSFRIGGPAEWFAQPDSVDELIEVLCEANRLRMSVSVIGGGTNILVADRGVRGLVIKLGQRFRAINMLSRDGDATVRLSCGAAVTTQHIVKLAAERGWGGIEALAGMPGQIGGAVVMNAQSIWWLVERVRLVSFDGTVCEFSKKNCRFQYRYAALGPGIVIDAILRLSSVPAEHAARLIRSAICRRNRTQEIRLPSAGCAFLNPAGFSAGRLIDEAGLKGSRIGDAQISNRHANFIVNLGNATCDEVLALMEYAQNRVYRKFHVVLEPEIRVIGECFRQ